MPRCARCCAARSPGRDSLARVGPAAVPEAALSRPVTGMNLMPGSLADQLGSEPVLLVFLRQFGCIFCRETVAELRQAAETTSGFPPVLFFFQGTPTEGRAFLRRYWREARAIADAEEWFYRAFGVERATLLQALGPAVWRAEWRARRKGHASGPSSGDIWRMPGVFLVRGAEILWRYEPRHAGDHPDFAAIPAAARSAPPPAG